VLIWVTSSPGRVAAAGIGVVPGGQVSRI